MPHGEKIAPAAAAAAALATLVCCLPIGIAGAAATASFATVVSTYRNWFLLASGGLLVVGTIQLTRAQRQCATRQRGARNPRAVGDDRRPRRAFPAGTRGADRRVVALMAMVTRGRIAIAVIAISAAVLGQPQFGTHNTPEGQPELLHLSTASVERLRSDFNRAAGDVRVVLLLSPT